jgi:hypothetical protein
MDDLGVLPRKGLGVGLSAVVLTALWATCFYPSRGEHLRELPSQLGGCVYI